MLLLPKVSMPGTWTKMASISLGLEQRGAATVAKLLLRKPALVGIPIAHSRVATSP